MQHQQRKMGQDFRATLKAAIGLPEQIDGLTEQIGKLLEVAEAQKQVAENAVKSADELNKQTNKLVEVANAQKQLAEEAGKQAVDLSKQIDRLVQETIALTEFTRVLVWLTVFIGIFAIIQIVIMLFEYMAKTK